MPEPEGSEERSAEEEVLQSIGRQSMLELIDSLSQEQQQVLTLKFVFNFSNAEAATILGQDGGRREVAPAPRARLAPEADRGERPTT